MNYDLAKELKDSGWPQHTCKNPTCGYCGHLSVPTLSELIEACQPDKFDDFGFLRNLDRWEAYAFYVGHFDFPERFKQEDGTNLVDLHCYSDCLEEAVARLWLALNKK